jgi:hypothetical protein
MSTQFKGTHPVILCAWAALAGLLVTALLPVFFFRFPGPRFLPLRYESMWAVTEVLWGPVRMLQTGLTPIVGYDLRQEVNPYYAAPPVNALMAFAAVAAFLILRNAWSGRARSAGASPDLRSVAHRMEQIRTDYPAALRQVPHPAAHAEARLQGARANLAKQPFLQRQSEAPEANDEDLEGA